MCFTTAQNKRDSRQIHNSNLSSKGAEYYLISEEIPLLFLMRSIVLLSLSIFHKVLHIFLENTAVLVIIDNLPLGDLGCTSAET